MGVVRKRTGCNSKYSYRNIATPASSLLSPMSSSSSSARQINISWCFVFTCYQLWDGWCQVLQLPMLNLSAPETGGCLFCLYMLAENSQSISPCLSRFLRRTNDLVGEDAAEQDAM
ncbi:hypothetical protein CerSpe_106590 [Prunus speciosa]